MDFDPWSGVTDALLFEWEELIEKQPDATTEPELRLAGWQSGRRPLGSFVIADDFINASSEEGLELLVRMQRQQEQEEQEAQKKKRKQQ